MMSQVQEPKTLQEAILYFSDADRCLDYLALRRWPDGMPICPVCGRKDAKFLANQRKWQCKSVHHHRQFSVKVGSIFEDSPIPLQKWLPAVWVIVNCKNGISSYELHRALGVTQKTAWFMLHRIRLAMQSGSIEKFSGRVEADETYIGAKARFMHKNKRTGKTGMVGKTAVLGLLERGTEGASRVRCKVLKRTRVSDLDPAIRENVEKGAEVMTDKLSSYYKLSDEYVHQVIDHAVSYAEGHVHTNGLENFWSLLKRGIRGTYVNVEPFHLFRYLDEQAFRFNERKDNDAGRFVKAVAGVLGKGLRYSSLIGKKSGDGLPPQTAGAW